MKYVLLLPMLTLWSCKTSENVTKTERTTHLVVTANFGVGGLQLKFKNRFTLYRGTRDRLLDLVPICVTQPKDKHLLLIEQYDIRNPRVIEWYILCAQTPKETWQRVAYLETSDSLLPFQDATLVNQTQVQVIMRDGKKKTFTLTKRSYGEIWKEEHRIGALSVFLDGFLSSM